VAKKQPAKSAEKAQVTPKPSTYYPIERNALLAVLDHREHREIRDKVLCGQTLSHADLLDLDGALVETGQQLDALQVRVKDFRLSEVRERASTDEHRRSEELLAYNYRRLIDEVTALGSLAAKVEGVVDTGSLLITLERIRGVLKEAAERARKNRLVARRRTCKHLRPE